MKQFALAFALLLAASSLAAQEPPTLTETQKLKAEVVRLKAQLLQAEYQLATCDAQKRAGDLVRERAAVEAELRAVLKPPVDAVLDWDSLTFKPKPQEKKP